MQQSRLCCARAVWKAKVMESKRRYSGGREAGGELKWYRREKDAGDVLDAGSSGRRSSAAAAIG